MGYKLNIFTGQLDVVNESSSGGGDVTSVNGQTGDVVLTAADLGLENAPTSIGEYDSQAPSEDGLVLTGATLYAQSATPEYPGMLSIGAQNIGGFKAFEGDIGTDSLTGLNGVEAFDVSSRVLKGTLGQPVVLLQNFILKDNNGNNSVNWDSDALTDANDKLSFNWLSRIAYSPNGSTKIFYGDTGVGIGTASPTATAALDVPSTTQGFKPPCMTTTQRDAISSPVEGLEIFNTTTHLPNSYNGSVWTESISGNQTITLSGEASGSGTTGISVTLLNASVIGKVLTGFTSGAGVVATTDTILQAFNKIVGNISGLVTGVSSVFGRVGSVVAQTGDYTTAQITEVTNLFFTNARAIAATLTGYVSGAGSISSSDTVLTSIQKLNGNLAPAVAAGVGLKQSFGITIDGRGGVPAVGSYGYIVIPYACTITNWYIVSNVSGSCVVDVKRSAISIVGAGNKPTLSTASSANAAVSSWTSTSVSANDTIEFNLDSATTLSRINLIIETTRT